MMFRALWIWQRWIGVWRPKLRRIALASAFEPSMMNRRGTAGSRPRPRWRRPTFVEKCMWPGSSPSAVVNGAAGMVIAALLVAALYAGRDLFMPLALAGLLGFVLAPLVRRLTNW